MRTALLLVDLQNDFVEDPRLFPPAPVLVGEAARILEHFRDLGLPVVHVHACVQPDGADRMPHLRAASRWLCVEGTRGAAPAAGLEPREGESLVRKTVFSPFTDPRLAEELRRADVGRVVVAGVHLHACVSKAALDAYERGFEVWIAEDAVASYDPLHAWITRDYLGDRGVAFLDIDEIFRRLAGGPAVDAEAGNRGERGGVDAAVAAAAAAAPRFAALAHERRVAMLHHWAQDLASRRDDLARLLATEIGKPVTEGRAEVARAADLIRATAAHFAAGPTRVPCAGGEVVARRRPLGVVAAITPFNNPIGIAVGKIAPALVFGNAVVWKPAPEAPRASIALMETLALTGFPAGVVELVLGGGGAALALIAEKGVAAVSFTGSGRAGRQAATLAASLLKPFQGELGGNNAAIVTPSCDVAAAAHDLAAGAFSFAGQRCTATRRIIVLAPVSGAFRRAFLAAVQALKIGDPHDPATQVGPVISRAARDRIERAIARAGADGARVTRVPLPLTRSTGADAGGRFVAPAIVEGADPASAIFQEETFGPVVVLAEARGGIDDAIALANGVRQGLVASIYSNDPVVQRAFLERIEAGVAKVNQATRGVHHDAPFLGWKESGLGPPEHGVWDEEFFTRVQAVYGAGAD